MNRREAIQAGLSVLAAAGVDGEVATVTPKNPQLVVFSLPRGKCMSEAARKKLRDGWKAIIAGTSLEGLKAIVLDDGMTMQVVDAPDDPSTPRDQMLTPTGRRDYAP